MRRLRVDDGLNNVDKLFVCCTLRDDGRFDSDEGAAGGSHCDDFDSHR